MPDSRRRTPMFAKALISVLVTLIIATAIAIAVLLATSPVNNPPAKPLPQPGLSLPSDFSLHDKIGQLLIVGVTDKDVATELESKYQIGGFLLKTGANLFNKEATDAVKQAGKLPPLFTIDQEGGEVSRLPNSEFRRFSAAHLGQLPDGEVQRIAQTMGQSMASIGVTNDLAPVVDLDNGHNAAISMLDRSFSSDPDIVAQKAMAFADGLRLAGIIPTFKHFPGLGKATGPTRGNTDTGPATTPPLSELKQSDLKPYGTLLQQNTVHTVMVGNQIVPGLTDGLPASLSPNAYDLLRSTYDFKQVIFTDELFDARAVANVQPSPAAAVIAAIKAGADMPLINPHSQQDVGVVIDAVVKAVRDGRIKETQINASLDRILQLKTSIKTSANAE